MTPAKTSAAPSHRASLALLIGLNVAFYALTQFPLGRILVVPLDTLVTTLHELGHAIVCLATGGSVSALTIVSDGDGHAGVTWCRGGIPFLYTQAGYLGAAFFGCVLIRLGRAQEKAKAVLKGLGALIAAASLFLIGPGLFHGADTTQALGSLAVGVGMAVVLLFLGAKLPTKVAHILLLILAGQTALNALKDTVGLIEISLGLTPYQGSFTDATNMYNLTHIPAAFWSVLWGVVSLIMLAVTLKVSYGKKSGGASA
jgi:hypothetical protein